MFYQIPHLTDSLPDLIGKGIFGLSFLSWQGNKMTYQQSEWLVYVFYAFVLMSLISCFIFKNQIRKNYISNTKIVVNIFQVLGIFLFSLSIFRIVILAVGGYPNLWELIPFHFCRMFIILIALSLSFRKIEYFKYFGVFAIGGGIIGMLIPDLSNSEYWSAYGGMEIGLDNYIFWDFFIIHISSIVLTTYLFACLNPPFYKSEIGYSILIMLSLTIAIFFANSLLSNVSDSRWRANWFYLSIPSVNGIDDMLKPVLGPLVSYPMILFTFIFIGIFMYSGWTFIYILSDSFQFIFRDKKTNKRIFKIKIVSSKNWDKLLDGQLKYRDKYNL